MSCAHGTRNPDDCWECLFDDVADLGEEIPSPHMADDEIPCTCDETVDISDGVPCDATRHNA